MLLKSKQLSSTAQAKVKQCKSDIFGLKYGVRLRKGTTDSLLFTIKDDLTGLTTHNAIGYGIRI